METPEERKAKAIAAIMRETDSLVVPMEEIRYVKVPADASLSMQELAFQPRQLGDALMTHLQSSFSNSGNSKGDGDTTDAMQTRACSTSAESLSQLGHYEVFPLVHAVAANDFLGVNLYFDQTGSLKGLPLNSRAMEYSQLAGYNPPPEFYGDVFLGRVRTREGTNEVWENLSFRVGIHTDMEHAEWLQQATVENAGHQLERNGLAGCRIEEKSQARSTGSSGRDSHEPGYSWTQTEEELEVTIELANVNVASKDVQVKFRPRTLFVSLREEPVLDLQLFEAVDVEGSSWALDKSGDSAKLVITLEKVEQALWSRIK